MLTKVPDETSVVLRFSHMCPGTPSAAEVPGTNDPPSDVCRGFGFVTFVDQAGVDKVLAQTRHELDSKTVSPLSANPL